MIARVQSAIALSLIALAMLWLWWSMEGGHPGLALAGLLLLFGGHAAFLAVEFCWMHTANGQDRAPRARSGQVIRAWLAESVHAPRVFLWRQPFRAACWPDRLGAHRDAGAQTQRGVLLVHGFVCNRGLWNEWLQRLAVDGVPVIALTLEPAFGSIDDYAPAIEDAIQRLERSTGMPPVVVAHSMGGLAFRRWWVDQPDTARVHHAITIATPHHGTRLARFAISLNGMQMREGGTWLQALAAKGTPEHLGRLTCFYSNVDNIVFPASAATLEGADNRLLPGTPHVAMVDHPEPWAELRRCLRT